MHDDNLKPTQAPQRHIDLAAQLSETHGKQIHPDVLVNPTCPISHELRELQDARHKDMRRIK